MDEESGDNRETAESKKSAYGERPAWQWILIYLVIAVVAYGLVYYFFLSGRGSY